MNLYFWCVQVRFCNHIGTTNKLSVFICNGCYSTKTKNQLPTMTISTVATSCSTDVVTVSASPATTTTPLPIASISGGGQHSITKSNVPFKPHYIHFKRKCRHCNLRNIVDTKSLSWELMDFCNEDCLGMYHSSIRIFNIKIKEMNVLLCIYDCCCCRFCYTSWKYRFYFS